MSRTPDQLIRDLEAQLAVQRAATTHYQRMSRRALDNLKLLGREDVAKSIEAEFNDMGHIVEPRTTAQPVLEPDDDDLF